VFVVPRYPWSQQATRRRLLSGWQNDLEAMSVGALAWSLPLAARELRWKTHVYPGVAIIVREVARK
jgi:hypothetical protein